MSKGSLKALIETNKGEIQINLFPEETPVTVASFVFLAQKKYYDGLNFHRVISDFMIQGGCPRGTGTAGPGYQFDDEIVSNLTHSKPGILSMANAGPGTNGSQFFITHGPTPWLDGKHTVFGEVVSDADQSTVNTIAQGDTIKSIVIEGDTESLFKQVQDHIDEWEVALSESFPNKFN